MSSISRPNSKTTTASQDAARRATSSFGELPARSLANMKSPFGIVFRRMKGRSAHYEKIDWKTPLGIFASLILMALILLDAPLGSFGSRWSGYVLIPADYITYLGQGGWYLIPAVLCIATINLTDWSTQSRRGLLLLYNRTALALFVIVSTGLSGLVSVVLKYSIGRARPGFYQDLGILAFKPFSLDPDFASFPSGHATTVGSIAAVLILFFPRSRIFVIPLAIWVAATRIVVGAHYPSDVVAGLGFGFAATILAAIFFARLGYLFEQVPYGMPTVKPTARILR